MLDYVPWWERPVEHPHDKADAIDLSSVSHLLAELEAIGVDEWAPIREFHDTLAHFVKVRVQLLEYHDAGELLGAQASLNEGAHEVVNGKELQIGYEEATALFRVSLAYLSGYFGSKALFGLGVTPNHLRSLGLPDLADSSDWQWHERTTHPQREMPDKFIPLRSPFPVEALPIADYADLVQLVFALCLYHDPNSARLSDYGVCETNLRGQQLGSHLRRLWELAVTSSDLRPVHQAVCDYIFARNLRGASRRAMALSGDADERILYADRLRASRIAENRALRYLRFTLKQFADRFTPGSLRLIGLQPPILTALGLGDLARFA